MDYAIWKRHSGSEELVYAKVFANNPYLPNNEFLFCPACGEPVILANGEERTYFRHCPNNPKNYSCPNYLDSVYAVQYQRQQEERKSRRHSKRIYILKRGETFGLFLGFPKLEEKTVLVARNEKLIVRIINPNNAELKENRILFNQVIPGETTYIQLKWIYDYYSLEYYESSVSQEIIKSWGEEQSGLPEEGALFRYSKNYARCISGNGEITTDKYYYFATAFGISDNTGDFLEYEYVGKLCGKTIGYESKWMVYRVQFTKFTKEALEFADSLGVTLVEWHPPLIPLWPPHVQVGNSQIYSKPTNILNLAQTDTSYYQETEGQSRRLIQKIPNNVGWLLCHPVRAPTHIKSSDRSYEASLTCEYPEDISQYIHPEITLEYAKKPLENGDSFSLKDKANLFFKSDCRCDIYHYSEKQLKSVYWNEQAILGFRNLSEGDKICVRHGLDTVHQVSIPKRIQKTVRFSAKKDEETYQELILMGGTFISTPVKVKYILSHLGKYPKVSNYLIQTLRSGKIPQKAYEHLISEFYKEIEN
ncbi:hypothetical protein E2N92_07365 [Methanofollis formosanus]|uniref:Uncharacterized protein n=1 Tax=Methanofollis formosanus TaxID=299308 RepID=A0A8G1A148_9EURY|nr:hypothetical protein [Methanofollis formosanus]QYZ79267.1 hypothetical protein E2N92_07365 [Methanofollis formosanus]